MNYEDVLALWGRNLLRTRGVNVRDDERVGVSLETETSGGCDTCSYTYVVVEARTPSGVGVTISDYEFTAILNELVALSAENADKISGN